jgi:hypothetical protein
VVGTVPKSNKTVVDILKTFSWVCEVIQRTSFSNDIVQIMTENTSLFERIRAVRAEMARVRIENGEKGVRLSLVHPLFHTKIDCH